MLPFSVLALFVCWFPLGLISSVPFWWVLLGFAATGPLLFIRPFQAVVLTPVLGARRPTPEEADRIAPLWHEIMRISDVSDGHYVVRVLPSDELNAYACGGHLVVVTSFALDELDDAELQGVLAHEVSHHLGLHTIAITIVHWLSAPVVALARVGIFFENVAIAARESFGRDSVLIDAVTNRQIEPSVIETACRRILRVTYRFACAEDPFEAYPIDLVAREDNRAIALEAAEKSAVLLKNDGVLPLQKSQKVGLFGELANLENTGDHGSSKVMPPYVITPLQGIADYLRTPDLSISGTETDVEAAARAAKDLDAAIIVVGTTADHEGEWIPGDIGAQALFGDGAQIPEGLMQLMSAMAEQRDKENENAGALGGGGNRGGDRER